MTQQVITTGDIITVRETITGAATNNGTMTISPARELNSSEPPEMAGRYLYGIVTYPHSGSDAPGAWTGSIVAAAPATGTTGMTILTISARSTSNTEFQLAAETAGAFVPLTSDWTLTLTGINSGKKVTVEALFV